MSNVKSFKINNIDSSINLASDTENGLMSAVSYNSLENTKGIITKINTVNFFDGLPITNCFFVSDGKVSKDSSYKGYLTDYIHVEPGDKFYVNISIPAIQDGWGIVYAYPDKSTTGAVNIMPATGQQFITNNSYYYVSTTLEIPDGCYYIRACSKIMDSNNSYLPSCYCITNLSNIITNIKDSTNSLNMKQIINGDNTLFDVKIFTVRSHYSTNVQFINITQTSFECYSTATDGNVWSVSEPIDGTGTVIVSYTLKFISSGASISTYYSNGMSYNTTTTKLGQKSVDGDYMHILDFDTIKSSWGENYTKGVYIWFATNPITDTETPLDVIVSNFKVIQINSFNSFTNFSGTTVYELFDSIDTKFDSINTYALDTISNGTANILATIEDIDNTNSVISEYDISSDSFIYSYLNNSGNKWATLKSNIFPTGNGTIYVSCKVTLQSSYTGYVALYISDGIYISNHFTIIKDIKQDGEYVIAVDTAYLVAHTSFDGSLGFNIWINNQNGAVSALIENFQVYEILRGLDTTVITGSTAKELFESVDAQLSTINEEMSSFNQIKLTSPAGNKYILSIQDDGTMCQIPIIPSKAVFFGNSLLTGFGSYGMAASDSTHDYYYLITEYIKTLNTSFTSSKTSASEFEGLTTTDETTVLSTIETIFFGSLDGTEELVVIQLGDNVNTTDKNTAFAANCVVLLKEIREKCPKARVVWIGMWYASTDRYTVIQEACDATGCEYVLFNGLNTTDAQNEIGGTYYYDTASDRTLTGVSDIVENSSNNITFTLTVGSNTYSVTMDVNSYSLSDTTLSYNGNYAVINSSGVASHPGNEGFRRIANKILYQLGISDSEETYAAE